MKNNNLNQKTDNFISEKIDWTIIQKEMNIKFGKDIYESWIKKLNLLTNCMIIF